MDDPVTASLLSSSEPLLESVSSDEEAALELAAAAAEVELDGTMMAAAAEVELEETMTAVASVVWGEDTEIRVVRSSSTADSASWVCTAVALDWATTVVLTTGAGV